MIWYSHFIMQLQAQSTHKFITSALCMATNREYEKFNIEKCIFGTSRKRNFHDSGGAQIYLLQYSRTFSCCRYTYITTNTNTSLHSTVGQPCTRSSTLSKDKDSCLHVDDKLTILPNLGTKKMGLLLKNYFSCYLLHYLHDVSLIAKISENKNQIYAKSKISTNAQIKIKIKI